MSLVAAGLFKILLIELLDNWVVMRHSEMSALLEVYTQVVSPATAKYGMKSMNKFCDAVIRRRCCRRKARSCCMVFILSAHRYPYVHAF